MRTPVKDAQGSFSGGLNTVADLFQLADNEMRVAENARLTVFGAVQKRAGTRQTHVTVLGGGAAVRGGFAWKRAGSVTELALSNGALHTGTYAIPMVWTAQAGAFDATAYPSFAPFRDATQEVCYIADGGPLNKWDGAAVTVNLAGTPNVSRIAVQNQRLFGISGVDQTLYYSALNNGDTLATGAVDTGSAVIRTFGNQELKSLLALGESLVVFHREGVSRFTGYTSDDISLATGTRGISADTGTIAPDSVVAVENLGYFLTDRGIYTITEAGVAPVSVKIENAISALDPTEFSRIKAVHNRGYREIWFHFPNVGVYIYNYRLGSWSGPFNGGYTNPETYSLWSTLDSTGRPLVLRGTAGGLVQLTDSGVKDNVLSDGTGGTAVTMTVQLRNLDCELPGDDKMFRKAIVFADTNGSSGYFLSWAVNGGGNGIKQFTPLISGGPVEFQLSGRGTSIQLTILDTDSGVISETSRVEISGISYGPRYAAR